MSDLLVRSNGGPDAGGSVLKVTPESAGWEYVGFEVLRLASGASAGRRAEGEEVCLVVLSGRCTISAGERRWELGGRKSVFAGLPHALYLPPGTDYRIEAAGKLELAVCSAPAERGVEPLEVRPEDIRVESRGRGSMEREIRPILMEDRPAERLLVVEVITPQGHWSSYPPHKHDRDDPPRERYLEETYYHRVSPERGFALQRVYTADGELDETFAVHDGDVALVPRGYHTVSAPPGYDLYYLNVMAGPVREWGIKNDPDHEWLLG
ncbi:5-deoxy-glucuronate isomerase [Rubrobacter xylanophilus DSM 9941]|uniref:5-deoxy-glucuronate isomerase n=1 Tax=Rubrobacter xylanophilus TaxID=49319 RepID=UPI001C644984|nr:5-deoxy-glucuronate isomerase [Rubrobacter xylanophilus]QYJ14992.1 5-deoxy-glucuronate isomerase [Rubrobacter xylanophilus DSM 9941]